MFKRNFDHSAEGKTKNSQHLQQMTSDGKPKKNHFMRNLIAGTVLLSVGSILLISRASAADLSAQDKQFLIDAAHGGNTEVAASKSAAAKASTAQVKSFAATMVNDHTKVGDELKQLASSKGVTVPDEPSKDQLAKIAKVNALEGDSFDRAYSKEIGVAAHKETVALFVKATKYASDPDVKAFAVKTLPALQHHLKMAEELDAQINKK